MERYYKERTFTINCDFDDFLLAKDQMNNQKPSDDYKIISYQYNPIQGTAKVVDKIRYDIQRELAMNACYNTMTN